MKMPLRQTADAYKGKFQEFEPFPRAGHPEGYKKVSPNLRKRILEEGESYLGYRYPSIFATDFMNFKRTGNRVAYEDLYFARRHALCALVTAECVEYKGRFMDDIVNGIFVLCEESGWQLPPHNSYQRDKTRLPLPDSARPVLDLFACETGALLSCVSYLLGQELEGISPLITARIQEELSRRIVTPYLREHFWWMGQGEEPMCNWTAWCTQNVLLTAFLGDTDQDTRRQVFRKAARRGKRPERRRNLLCYRGIYPLRPQCLHLHGTADGLPHPPARGRRRRPVHLPAQRNSGQKRREGGGQRYHQPSGCNTELYHL